MNAGPLSLTTLGIPTQANISFRNLIVENFVMDVVLYTSNLIVQASTAIMMKNNSIVKKFFIPQINPFTVGYN